MNIKFPVSWLRDYLTADIAAKTLAEKLSLSGPSVEKIEKKGHELILDVEVTSNRPDASTIFGLAREAHAILSYQKIKSALTQPKGLDANLQIDTAKPLTLDVVIRDRKLCPRFTAIIVDNVKIGPAPAQVKNRLESSGIRSINNIVDITNYVMLETGQPMHAFDYDKVEGAKMTLRASKKGEKIKTLDDQNWVIPEGSIIIEDAKKIIDLCGIMGGANSQITKRTKRVILFVQSYDPYTIRKTTQALAFRTDAAARFEKGVDIENIPNVLRRAVYLAKRNAGAQIASELLDIYETKKERPKEVNLKMSKLNSYLGTEIKIDEAKRILDLLGFKTKTLGQTLSAVAPSWRRTDIEEDVDLIEEIARIYGYFRIPSALPSGQIPIEEKNELGQIEELKNGLRFLGLTEVISYSIISKKLATQTDAKSKEIVELANPLTEEWQFMRPELLPSLLQVVSGNQYTKENIRIFEAAKTYLKQKNDIPKQDMFLSVALTGSDFYQIKGLAENIFDILKRKVQFEKLKEERKLVSKGQSASLFSNGEEVGFAGMINPYAQEFFQISNKSAALELNLSKVLSLPQVPKAYKPISKYPPVIEDVSALFGEGTDASVIISHIKKASDLISKAEIIDVYKSESMTSGKKSVTIRITYQKQIGTPTPEEVAQAREKIISELTSTFHAQIRK